MATEDSAAALKALQDDLYRERILRARAMTPGERLGSAFDCSNLSLQLAHGVAMQQKKLASEEAGWEEVGKRLDRARRLHDHGFFCPVPS